MLEIPNLKKNTEYTVRVYARNKVSFGEAAEILAKTKFVGRYDCDIYFIHIHKFPFCCGFTL